MVEIADVKGEDSLKVYLNGLPTDRRQPVSVAVASRAALRAAPGWNWYFGNDKTKRSASGYISALFRCTLTSAVAPVSTTAEVRQAAAAAATAAAATAAAAAAFWESVRNDLRFLLQVQNYKGLYATRLWAGEQVEPSDLHRKWAGLRDVLLQDAADWSFWIGFYEAMLHGRAQNWEMLTEIALLPDEDWRKGPQHMNPLIAEVVGRYEGNRPKTPKPEDLSPARQRQLNEQVAFLLRTSPLQEVTATALADQIEISVSEYLQAEKKNELPPELQIIQLIGTSIRAIGAKVGPAKDEPLLVADLKQQILDLEAEVLVLNANLRKAEYRDSFDRYFEIAMENGAKWAGPAMFATAASFVYNFVDPGTLYQYGDVLRTFLKSRL
ncbi:MAG: hypothetical protein KDA67_00910 [Rhodobacteraceae bacterium]|nr:hypothetical protein [Paracoccaceae bacterium]